MQVICSFVGRSFRHSEVYGNCLNLGGTKSLGPLIGLNLNQGACLGKPPKLCQPLPMNGDGFGPGAGPGPGGGGAGVPGGGGDGGGEPGGGLGVPLGGLTW